MNLENTLVAKVKNPEDIYRIFPWNRLSYKSQTTLRWSMSRAGIDFEPYKYGFNFDLLMKLTLDDLKDTKDYIDISISNNLLINNRKLRRKLEVMLEKGNFSSVEYIDDIVQKGEDGEEISEAVTIDEESLDISIKLEYESYIKEYILKQK